MKISCQKVIQNNVEFYLGKIKFRELEDISTVSHRIIMGFDENDRPVYNTSIQREVNPARKNSIKDYLLEDEEATFPNSIILSIPSILLQREISDSELVDIIIDKSLINLFDKEEPLYIQIIDGQHRFAGMKAACDHLREIHKTTTLDRLLDFEFVVSFFIDATIEFQAMLFSTINRTQAKVSNDIVYDLFGLIAKDSPQKTALAICLELNSTKKNIKGQSSPFSRRIKLLGKKEKGEKSYLSQQIFIKTILTLICPSIKASEVERFKERGYFREGGNYRTIFRDFYSKNSDSSILKTLDNFFIAVEETFLDVESNSYWKIEDTPDNPFQKTIGFLALIEVLIVLYHKGISEKRLNVEFFKENLSKASKIKLLDVNNISLYPYTSKGKTELARDLINMINA